MVSRDGSTGRLVVTSFWKELSLHLWKNIAAVPLKGDRCDAILSFLCWNGQENAQAIYFLSSDA